MHKDPYKPPDSDVRVDARGARSIGWKIYFFLITILSAFSFLGVFTFEGVGVAEYVSVVLWVPATAALFGFAFVRPVANPGFWRYFLVVYLVCTFAYYFVTNIDFSAGMTATEYMISNAIGWALALPGYIALYLYSRPGDIAWRKGSQD